MPGWRHEGGGRAQLEGDAVQLYERLYCARGEAESRIKEAQLDLFGTRASCHRFAANQLRLLFAALADTLMQRLRDLALNGSELERATAATIRVRLLKIGAAIVRNTRRVRVLLASHHPLRSVFLSAHFSDRGRLFQSDRGRRFSVIADGRFSLIADARGMRASEGLNVSQSSAIRLKR